MLVARGSRSAGDDELVRGKAGTFVGLKHAVTEGVLLGHREVGLNVGLFHVHVLRIGMRVGRTGRGRSTWNQICAIHLPAVVHGNEMRRARG